MAPALLNSVIFLRFFFGSCVRVLLVQIEAAEVVDLLAALFFLFHFYLLLIDYLPTLFKSLLEFFVI